MIALVTSSIALGRRMSRSASRSESKLSSSSSSGNLSRYKANSLRWSLLRVLLTRRRTSRYILKKLRMSSCVSILSKTRLLSIFYRLFWHHRRSRFLQKDWLRRQTLLKACLNVDWAASGSSRLQFGCYVIVAMVLRCCWLVWRFLASLLES